MRCRIRLEPLKGFNTIPINYNSAVSQFVYELLEPDQPFANRANSSSSNEGILYYTFSNLYIPDVRLQGRYLEFGRVPVELMISLLAEKDNESEILERMRTLTHFDVDAFGLGDPDIKNASFEIRGIDILPEEASFGNRCKFRMLSPLAAPLVEQAQHVHYHTHEFSEAIRQTLISKYTRWKGKPPEDQRFVFRLDEGYVQRRRGRISKLVTFNEMSDDERRIKALISPFECEGNPELIWLGYVAGFGEKNVLGFGCTEPIAEQVQQERPALQIKRASRPSMSAM